MGDRANIVIYDPSADAAAHEAVFLYSHWSGSELPEILKAGLERAPDRWSDGPYLARVLFQQLLGNQTGTTGFGISTRMTDNSYPLLVVDVRRQVVVEFPESEYEASGFAALGRHKGVPIASYSGKWKRKAAA